MGWASEQMIEDHNAMMADEAYAEEYLRQMAEEEQWQMLCETESEKLVDFFFDYRIDFNGYEEFDLDNFDFDLNFADDLDVPF